MKGINWLIEVLNHVKPDEFCSIEKIKELLEQAKEMEEKQRMYSEEDMIAFLDWFNSYNNEVSAYRLSCTMKNEPFDSKVIFSMWFETFKSK
jgi:hypothetical protein